MARDVDVFDYYIIQLQSNILVTVVEQGPLNRLRFLFSFIQNGKFHPDWFYAQGPAYLVDHATYVEINSTANNNWQVVRSGGDEIVPLQTFTERLTNA